MMKTLTSKLKLGLISIFLFISFLVENIRVADASIIEDIEIETSSSINSKHDEGNFEVIIDTLEIYAKCYLPKSRKIGNQNFSKFSREIKVNKTNVLNKSSNGIESQDFMEVNFDLGEGFDESNDYITYYKSEEIGLGALHTNMASFYHH